MNESRGQIRVYTRIIWLLAESKVHSSGFRAATLSSAALSFWIASFVSLRTSSAEWVHVGGGWGGVREAMAGLVVWRENAVEYSLGRRGESVCLDRWR